MFDSRRNRRFSFVVLSRPSPVPAQPPMQYVKRAIPQGLSGRGITLTPLLDLVIKIRNDWKSDSTRRPRNIMGRSVNSSCVTLVLYVAHMRHSFATKLSKCEMRQ